MNAMTSCCAPAPIDSMATTAATPKIMPIIVSSERSLCARRLSSPRRSSGRKSDVVPLMRVATMVIANRRPPAASESCCWWSGARRSDPSSATSVPSDKARDGGAALGEVLDLDLALLEAVADLHEDVRLPVLLEHGLTRHVQRIGDFFALNRDARRRARLQPRIGLVELERHVEEARDCRALEPLRTAARGRRARPPSRRTLSPGSVST